MKEGWNCCSLGSVCKIYNGNSINAEYKKTHYMGLSEGYPFIATKDVSFDGIIDYDNGVKIPFDSNLKVANPNSVFICVEGGSAGRKIGLVMKPVCFGNKLFCLEPNNTIEGAFLYYYLKSNVFQEQFAERLTGLIGGVSAKKFNEIDIVFPNIDEQHLIVDFLDASFKKIDTIKNNAEKALKESKALFQKSLKELLAPQANWNEMKLSDIGELKNGMNFGKNESGVNVHILGVGDFCDLFEITNTDQLSTISLNTSPSKDYILKDEDIVFVRSNGNKNLVGRCVLVHVGEEPCSYSGFCIRFRKNKEDVDANYLTHFLKTESARKEFVGNGANISNLNQKILNQFVVSFPSLAEQKTIVATLDSVKSKVDKLQENYDRILDECNALKQAILKQVFE